MPNIAIRHLLLLACLLLTAGRAQALPGCDEVASQLNQRLNPKLDSRELAEVLSALAQSQFRQLPPKYINKRGAEAAGWRPGKDLWSIPELKGKSIGGDRFGNCRQGSGVKPICIIAAASVAPNGCCFPAPGNVMSPLTITEPLPR